MPMTSDERDAFLQEPRIASLVTLREDGSPTVQPVWYEWDGTEARVFTSPDSGKVGRINEDPRVALSVEEPVGVPEAWVTIEGRVTVDGDGGFELAKRLAERYYEPAKAAEAIATWEPMEWVVLRITPERVISS